MASLKLWKSLQTDNGEIIKNLVIYSVNIESMEDLGF